MTLESVFADDDNGGEKQKRRTNVADCSNLLTPSKLESYWNQNIKGEMSRLTYAEYIASEPYYQEDPIYQYAKKMSKMYVKV